MMTTTKRRARKITQFALLSLAAAVSDESASQPPTRGADAATVGVGTMPYRHLTADSPVDELLRHPAFSGFAPLMLPWDNRDHGRSLTFNGIGTLLPYHTEVNPSVVVGAINQLVDAVGRGDTVFHNIYDQATQQRQVDKLKTGLFHFRGRPGAPFAIIAAGGGNAYVASVHEGFPYAQEVSKAGFHAFVLKYRVGQGGAIANEDMAAAVAYVMRNAERLGVSREHYSVWGSSAGARMAASIGSHGTARYGAGELPKPSAVVMAYTAHADHADVEPPTFAVVGENDGISPPASMRRRVEQLRRLGARVELHEFAQVAHGFGPGTGTTASGWIANAIRFWRTTIK